MAEPRSERGSATIVVAICVIVGLAVGGGLVFFARMMTADAMASLSWPTADATIVHSEVQIVPDTDGSDDYKPLVVYVYTVGTESFTRDRIAFGVHNSGDRSGVERTVARYTVGSVVPVAYDPDDPGRSVLEPGNEGFAGVIEWVGFGFIAAGLGAFAIAVTVRLSRRGRSAADQPWDGIPPPSFGG